MATLVKNKKDEMTNVLISVVSGMVLKFSTIMNSIWLFLTTTVFGLLAFFLPIKYMVILIFVLIGADFLFGILSAIKQKKPITSEKMRGTLFKIFLYLVILCSVFAVDVLIFKTNILHPVLFALCSMIEILSIAASGSILLPNNPFLRIISFLVKGEIQSKLNLSKEELEEFFKRHEKSKTKKKS